MKDFLRTTHKTHSIQQQKKDKLDFIKIKISCSLKDTIKNKIITIGWEKIFANNISHKDNLKYIYKLLQIISKI